MAAALDNGAKQWHDSKFEIRAGELKLVQGLQGTGNIKLLGW